MNKFFAFTWARPIKFGVAWALICLAAAATADIKMVSRMTMTNSIGGTVMPQTVTAYFKKGMMRSDVGGISTLMNAKTGQNLIIDHTNKTYSKFDLLGAMNGNAGMLKGMKLAVSGSVKPTNKRKMIAGKPAQMYTADFTFVMTLPKRPGQKQTAKM